MSLFQRVRKQFTGEAVPQERQMNEDALSKADEIKIQED